jgi:hypothetical protein
MSLPLENHFAHPRYAGILDRLASCRALVEEVLAERKVTALLAFGSVPCGYEHAASDLDLLAFTPLQERKMHLFDRNKVIVKETSFDAARVETRSYFDQSILPQALVASPCALLYVGEEAENQVDELFHELYAACCRFLATRLGGEIRWGQARQGFAGQPVTASLADITGCFYVGTALINPKYAAKLERVRTRTVFAPLRLPECLPAGWTLEGNSVTIPASWEAPPLSAREFVLQMLRAALRFWFPPAGFQVLQTRGTMRHYHLKEVVIHEALPTRRVPVTKALGQMLRAASAITRPCIARQYGRLEEVEGSWCYEGIGTLANKRPARWKGAELC